MNTELSFEYQTPETSETTTDESKQISIGTVKRAKKKKTTKKRGPKKKTIRIKPSLSLKLNDSDIESCSEEDNYFDFIGQTKEVTDKKKDNDRPTFNKPWIEKYRPIEVEDLVLESGTLNKIKKIILEKDMPNIIITGSPGVGKTTTILCIAKKLLGRHLKAGVLELNASDDRGVKTVQESIEYFCKKKLEISDNYSSHKIILLDEADNMTKKAQQSINNLMQQYHHNTRFAFTCNNSSEIIEAIQSRCIIFRYSKISNDQIKHRLEVICAKENVPFTEEGLSTVVLTAQGDLRQAINNLQLTFNGYIDVIPENVFKLCDKPHPLVIQNIFDACNKKQFKTALVHLSSLQNKGYSSSDIIFTMIYTLKTMDKSILDEATKIYFMEEIGRTSLIVSRGVNTPLQLTGCLAALCKE
jgi:replication factor C subunit 2/4